jgi:ABC-2 type transport system permease protein
MQSVVGNFALMSKVYIPKYIFPVSKVLFCGINFLLTLIPLALIIFITGFGETPCVVDFWYLLLPYVFLCMLLFTLGLGLLLSTISVFLRDMFYIYGIILTIWNYVTPIFYDISIIPESIQPIFKLNPLYLYINGARTIILNGECPDILSLLAMFLVGIITLLFGSLIFKKNQDKFVYYA